MSCSDHLVITSSSEKLENERFFPYLENNAILGTSWLEGIGDEEYGGRASSVWRRQSK